MAVLKKDEFFERVKNRIGDDSSDDAISFIEDVTDTYNELEQRSKSNDGVDWEKKYYENDEAWKRRYKNRFYNGNGGYNGNYNTVDEEEKEEYDPNSVTIDKLFNKED